MDSEHLSAGRLGRAGRGQQGALPSVRVALPSVLSPHREGRPAAAFQLTCPLQTRRACPTHGLSVHVTGAGARLV